MSHQLLLPGRYRLIEQSLLPFRLDPVEILRLRNLIQAVICQPLNRCRPRLVICVGTQRLHVVNVVVVGNRRLELRCDPQNLLRPAGQPLETSGRLDPQEVRDQAPVNSCVAINQNLPAAVPGVDDVGPRRPPEVLAAEQRLRVPDRGALAVYDDVAVVLGLVRNRNRTVPIGAVLARDRRPDVADPGVISPGLDRVPRNELQLLVSRLQRLRVRIRLNNRVRPILNLIPDVLGVIGYLHGRQPVVVPQRLDVIRPALALQMPLINEHPQEVLRRDAQRIEVRLDVGRIQAVRPENLARQVPGLDRRMILGELLNRLQRRGFRRCGLYLRPRVGRQERRQDPVPLLLAVPGHVCLGLLDQARLRPRLPSDICGLDLGVGHRRFAVRSQRSHHVQIDGLSRQPGLGTRCCLDVAVADQQPAVFGLRDQPNALVVQEQPVDLRLRRPELLSERCGNRLGANLLPAQRRFGNLCP